MQREFEGMVRKNPTVVVEGFVFAAVAVVVIKLWWLKR
jgi:hypothetical protein